MGPLTGVKQSRTILMVEVVGLNPDDYQIFWPSSFELCYEDYANDEFDEFKSKKDFHDWLHMLDENEPVEII